MILNTVTILVVVVENNDRIGIRAIGPVKSTFRVQQTEQTLKF